MALTITIPGAVETTTGSTAPAILTVGVGSPGVGVPSGGTSGQVLQKLSGVSYDTGWLTLPADYITSVTSPLAVASGVLSVDLSAYLPLSGGTLDANSTIDASTATVSSTFAGDALNVQLSANPSENSSLQYGGLQVQNAVGTMSVTPAGLTFPNASTQTVAYPGSSTFLLKAGNLSGLADTAVSRTNLGLGTMSTATAADYSTTVVADGLYYPLSGNPSAFLVAADIVGKANLASPTFTGTPLSTTAAADTNTTQIATTAYVIGQASSTSPVIDGTATVGTSLKYARADHVHPTDTSLAPLASPTFTGTPTLPTGTIATTQTPGNNTTAVATTAFVTAAVPAFATNAQAVTGTSATTALSPSLANFSSARGLSTRFEGINVTNVAGSGAVTAGYNAFREMYTSTTASVGRAGWFCGSYGVSLSILSSRADAKKIDFSKKIWLYGRFSTDNTGFLGDANTMSYITLGGYTGLTTGAMTSLGIGLSKVGGVSSFINLIVHNGTSQTNVATTNAINSTQVVDYVIYSDGAGNVTLFLDGVQAATTSAGPTGITASMGGLYREQVESTISAAVRQLMHCYGGGIIIEG